MCILEDPNVTLKDLMVYYSNRIDQEDRNVNRIKKLYSNEEEFSKLMNRIIEKDEKRVSEFLKQKAHIPDIENNLPTPWKVLFTIMEIAQRDGKRIPPFDTLTKSYPSRTLLYMGWKFSMVHGKNSLVSIYNNENDLVYQF